MKCKLDERLRADCHLLGRCGNNILLLSKNALFPWFILVPDTAETEYHRLNNEQQTETQQHINAIAHFIETHFETDKINIATIGNIVPQLHIHVIGRNRHDPCWPGVVWGTSHKKSYAAPAIADINDGLRASLKEVFQPVE